MSLPNFDTSSLNVVDFIGLAIIILSIFIGLIRGFTREFLGALGWVGAVLITFWTRTFLQEPMRHWIGNSMVADLITIVVIFVVSLFILLSITRAASLRVKASVLGGLDRSLGVIFGTLRGGIICIVIFLMVNLYFKPYRRPPEVRESRAFPYLLKGTELVASFLPHETIPASFYHPYPSVHKGEEMPHLSNPTSQELTKTLAQPRALSSQQEQSGYHNKNRLNMDRLFKNYNQEKEE
ncbi:MAG: CvpA family protein [Janthinobacterium lividum]